MNKSALVILAGNGSFTVWEVAGRSCEALTGQLPYDEAGQSDLLRLAMARRGQCWRVLVDQVEEEFQSEKLPALGSRDARALLGRRLEQQFRGTSYRLATPVTRSKLRSGREFLLSALTRREPLDLLLATLLDARSVIAGVHSIAMLLQVWQKKLAADSPHSLLLGEFIPGQLRQTYCQHAGLLFSRQALLTQPGQPNELANEIRRTRQYLTTLRQMGRDEPLDVLLLCDPLQRDASEGTLQEALKNDAPQILLRSAYPEDLGIRPGGDSFAWLHAALVLVAGGGVHNQYAPAEACHHLHLQRVGRVLYLAGGGVLLAGVLVSVQLLAGSAERQDAYLHAQKELTRTVAEKQRVDAQLASQPAVDPAWVRDVTLLAERALSSRPEPEAAAKAASHILLDFPSLRVDRFDWSFGIPPRDAELLKTELPESIESRDAAASQTVQPDQVQEVEYFVLSGSLRAEAGEYRQAMAQFEELMARTRQLRHVSVEALKWPIDVRSDRHVGGEGKQVTQSEREFVLLVKRMQPVQGNSQ